MKGFWKQKGKRAGALLLAAALLLGMLPVGDGMAAAAAETPDAVKVSGKILVSGDNDGETVPYEGAAVTLSYPATRGESVEGSSESVGEGSTENNTDDIVKQTQETTTGADGSYTFEISDWTLQENDEYQITVMPKTEDAASYQGASKSKTVTAEQAATGEITVEDILLNECVFYQITVSADPSDGSGGTVDVQKEDGTGNSGSQIPPGEKRVIKAEPAEGYEIKEIRATKGGQEFTDENLKVGEDGKLSYEIAAVDADMEFTVKFAPKKYKFQYTVAENGKLVLNGDNENPYTGNNTVEVEYTSDSYDIKAICADGYRLSSFQINDKEENGSYVLEEKLPGGCLQEYSCKLTNVKRDYEIIIEVVADVHTVTVSPGENGSISIDKEGTAKIAHGTSVVFTVTPNSGYKVTGITKNGSALGIGKGVTRQKDGSYTYQCSVTEDITVGAEFGEITKTPTTLEQLFGEEGFQLSDKEGNTPPRMGDDGKYYAKGEFTLKSPEGKLFRCDKEEAYQKELTIGETKDIQALYIIDEKPEGFGTEKILELSANPLSLCTDGVPPVLELADGAYELWRMGDCEAITLAGKTEDTNLRALFYSREKRENPEQDLNNQETSIHLLTLKDGAFEEQVKLAEGTDEDTFYLYAVDWAGNYTEQTVRIYRDGTAPEITALAVNAADMAKLPYGNFYSKDLTMIVTVNDITNLEGQDVNASGVDTVQLYADGEALEAYRWEAHTAGTQEPGFTIPAGKDYPFFQLKKLQIEVTDRVGNSRMYDLNDKTFSSDTGITSAYLMIENVAPNVTLDFGRQEDYQETKDGETCLWFRELPDFQYHVSDRQEEKPGSGIAERHVYLSETELADYAKKYEGCNTYEEVPQEDSGLITAESLESAEDGRNVVTVQYHDVAGNTGSASKTFYLDTHQPEITGFEIEKTSSKKSSVLNKLTFGLFSNDEVKITVTAQDAEDSGGNEIPSSGLKSITLYLDGEAYQTKLLEEGSQTAEFILPEEAVKSSVEKCYLDRFVTAEAEDYVGNRSGQVDMTTGNSNLESSNLMIETVKPGLSVDINPKTYQGKGGVLFNNTETAFDVKASDADAGLRSVTISINDTVLVSETYTAEQKKEAAYQVDTGDIKSPKDGKYVLEAVIVDNAGNETEYTSTDVYLDDTAPEILRFEMKADGMAEADGTKLSFTETDYGYYFLEDTKVTVYAGDGTGDKDVGVKEISYYTVDVDGKQSAVVTKTVDSMDSISFVVKAGFKGQIYAQAYDLLLNHTGKYVTPDSLVIETPNQHEKEEHLLLQKAQAPYRDKDGGELYAGDVEIAVTVSDTFSGIRSVEWSVQAPYSTENNQTGRVELDNDGEFTEESNAEGWSRTKTEKNLVTELQKNIRVSNNSNDISVSVRMTDRAGNTSEKELSFSIDKTEPVITIEFDNNTPDAQYTDIYKENRTATVTVKERNFNPSDFAETITNTDGAIPQLSGWQTSENAGNPDDTVNTATITFSEDGDYTFRFNGHDMAGNAAKTVETEDFTLDKTIPVITVTYDNDNALNGNYYAAERTATIQIEEHNFAPERVTVTGTVTDHGNEMGFPSVSGWSTSGDIHTATISCSADGLYRFDVAYTDQAGNEAEPFTGEEYYVDMTEPQVEITGVENLSANNGDVIPQISFSDTNYDQEGTVIELTGANRGAVTPDGAYSAQADGQIFTFNNFPKEQESDDIYTLTATLRDKAGNESTDSIVFSVNRFGSVYVFDDSLKKIAGTYIQKEIDIQLTEVNVDSLQHDETRVVVDMNGQPRDLKEGTDYTVHESGGNGSWYRYDYTINKSLFTGDGRYIVTLYSRDAAGNVNENIDESKKAEISFGVDKTAPIVTPIDIESDTQYPVDVKSAKVAVNDNLVLENVDIYIGDKRCEYEIEAEDYTFDIPSSSQRQDITVAAVDAAGNRTNYVISGVLVTTNVIARWYNNKPLFAGTLVGAAVAGGGGTAVVILWRRRRSKK